MDIGRIFSRSIELMWRYKFLWIFALVMGLTSGAAGGGGSPNFNYQFGSGDNPLRDFRVEPALIGLAVLLGLVMLVLWLVLFFYFRFVSRGAMVDTVRGVENQENPELRDAWKSGRKFYTRLLGLGALVNLPLMLFSVLVILLGFIPLFAGIGRLRGGDLMGRDMVGFWITGLLAICCSVLCVFLITFIIHPLYEMSVRAIVLEDLSVREGLRRGIQRTRERLGDVLVVYLLLIGARFGYGMLTAIVAIPVGAVLFAGALALSRTNFNALILAALIGAIPLWLLFGALEGVFQLFESNVWTEAYLTMDKPKETAA